MWCRSIDWSNYDWLALTLCCAQARSDAANKNRFHFYHANIYIYIGAVCVHPSALVNRLQPQLYKHTLVQVYHSICAGGKMTTHCNMPVSVLCWHYSWRAVASTCLNSCLVPCWRQDNTNMTSDRPRRMRKLWCARSIKASGFAICLRHSFRV